jgi:DNA-binding MarR family transcriptional regulator
VWSPSESGRYIHHFDCHTVDWPNGEVARVRPAEHSDPADAAAAGQVDAGVDAVLQALRAVALGVDRYRQALGARHSLGVTEIVTLGQLLYDGPVRAGEVSARTGLTQSSVTALLDRLEGRGLVTRTRPSGNRRIVLVVPTSAGRELGRAIFGPMRAGLRDVGPGAPSLDILAECLDYTATFLDRVAARLREDGPA